jgi:hypothetical protein
MQRMRLFAVAIALIAALAHPAALLGQDNSAKEPTMETCCATTTGEGLRAQSTGPPPHTTTKIGRKRLRVPLRSR